MLSYEKLDARVMDWRSVEETIWRTSHRKRAGLRRGHERQYLLHFATETMKLALGLDNWYLQHMHVGEIKPTLIMFIDESSFHLNPYPTAFPYGNGMVLHFYQQQESSTTKTVHKVINKGLKPYV